MEKRDDYLESKVKNKILSSDRNFPIDEISVVFSDDLMKFGFKVHTMEICLRLKNIEGLEDSTIYVGDLPENPPENP